MATIEIYTKSWCGYCARAKRLLDAEGLPYREFDVTSDRAREREMVHRSGRRTVPQVFVGGRHLGGSDDLYAARNSGELDRLLGGEHVGDAA